MDPRSRCSSCRQRRAAGRFSVYSERCSETNTSSSFRPAGLFSELQLTLAGLIRNAETPQLLQKAASEKTINENLEETEGFERA